MSLNLNQFTQTPVVGMLDPACNPNPSVMQVRFNPGATSTLRIQAGEGVVLSDLGASDVNGVPIVIQRATNATAIYGVKVYDTKKGEIEPGEVFSVAMEGSTIVMEASAAIVRGALVALVIASKGKVVTRTTEEILGIALDKAAADGDLIRVKITARGFAELPLYETST